MQSRERVERAIRFGKPDRRRYPMRSFPRASTLRESTEGHTDAVPEDSAGACCCPCRLDKGGGGQIEQLEGSEGRWGGYNKSFEIRYFPVLP